MLIVLLVCTPCGFVVLYKSDLLLFVYTKLQVCHPWGVVSLSITIRMEVRINHGYLIVVGVFKCLAVFRAYTIRLSTIIIDLQLVLIL